MTKRLTILITCLLFCFEIFSQEFNYNSGRLAVSFDGNSEPDIAYKWPTGDPDDWGASVASMAIIAKLSLQDRLVHCSYNNFIDAPSGPDSSNQMKISLDGASDRWNFKQEIFFDVTTQREEGLRNLISEITISSADNPLYFIHAGLSEFLYQAIERIVSCENTDCLRHIYIVSHSKFNEREKRREYHHDFDDIQILCNNKLNYIKIHDQNDKTNPNNLWNSGANFSVWHWMRDHDDKNIRWMYSRINAHSGKVADISDCGMFYYLLVGDKNGNPEKFKDFINEGIIL